MNRWQKVLLVDDELELLEVLKELLELAGFSDIFLASRADEAFEMLMKRELDLVVSDVRMPHQSGLDLLRKVRKEKPKLPVILLTGFADIDLRGALRMGAFDLLEKPIDSEVLDWAIVQGCSPPSQRFRATQKISQNLPLKTFALDREGLLSVEWTHRGLLLPQQILSGVDIGECVALQILGDSVSNESFQLKASVSHIGNLGRSNTEVALVVEEIEEGAQSWISQKLASNSFAKSDD